MRPVCCNCECEMGCFKTGMYVTHDNRKWSGDGFICHGCGARVVTGYGQPLVIQDYPTHEDDWVLSLDGKVPSQHIGGEDSAKVPQAIDTNTPTD